MTEDEYISLELAKTRIEAAANYLQENKIILAWENLIKAGSCLEQIMKKTKIERECDEENTIRTNERGWLEK